MLQFILILATAIPGFANQECLLEINSAMEFVNLARDIDNDCKVERGDMQKELAQGIKPQTRAGFDPTVDRGLASKMRRTIRITQDEIDRLKQLQQYCNAKKNALTQSYQALTTSYRNNCANEEDKAFLEKEYWAALDKLDQAVNSYIEAELANAATQITAHSTMLTLESF